MSMISRDPPAGTIVPAGPGRVTTSPTATEQVERHRAALRKFAADRGLSISELGRSIGLTTANSFYNFLNGRSSSLSFLTLIRICDRFPGTTLDQLAGRNTPPKAVMDGGPAEQIEDGQLLRLPSPNGVAPSTQTNGPLSMEPDEDPTETCAASFVELGRALRSLQVAISDLERNCHRASAAMATMHSVA